MRPSCAQASWTSRPGARPCLAATKRTVRPQAPSFPPDSCVVQPGHVHAPAGAHTRAAAPGQGWPSPQALADAHTLRGGPAGAPRMRAAALLPRPPARGWRRPSASPPAVPPPPRHVSGRARRWGAENSATPVRHNLHNKPLAVLLPPDNLPSVNAPPGKPWPCHGGS